MTPKYVLRYDIQEGTEFSYEELIPILEEADIRKSGRMSLLICITKQG